MIISTWKEVYEQISKQVRTISNLPKAKMLVIRQNQPKQKSISKSLNKSATTLNKIISQDLQLKQVKKYNDHHLLLRHVAHSRTFGRTLYENYLARGK